jgi:hypothetical protein
VVAALDSSRSFESHESKVSDPLKRAEPVRARGHRGGVISMHRALTQFRLGTMNLIVASCLFVFFSAAWVILLPLVCRLWTNIFAFGIRSLPLHAELGLAEHHWTRFLNFDIPYLKMEPVLPSAQIWWLTCAITTLIFVAAYFISQRLIPLIYLLRGILLVQAIALLYFAFIPASFPHTPESYLAGFVTSGIVLISLVPLAFGLTYYIFDFGMPRKALLTSMTMVHLALFLPFQVLLQALVLQKTVLFMPVLYIIFGMPVDVMLVIAFYSWGMTWSFRSEGV